MADLYQFLLLNKDSIQASKEFTQYTSNEMYEKLKAKYQVTMSVLEYLLNLASAKVEEGDRGLRGKKIPKSMEKIKRSYTFSDDVKEAYRKYMCGKSTDEEAKSFELLGTEEERSLILQAYEFSKSEIDLYERFMNEDKKITDRETRIIEVFKADEKKALIKYIVLKKPEEFDVVKYERCKNAVYWIETLKKVFYGTYGFNEQYIDHEWKNACEEETKTLERFMEMFYTFETSRLNEDGNIDETDDDDYIQPRHLYMFKYITIATQQISDTFNWDDRFKLKWRKNFSMNTYGTADSGDLVDFVLRTNELSDGDGPRSSIVPIIEQIENISRREMEALGKLYSHEPNFIKYRELCDKLRDNLNIYKRSKSGLRTSYENEEQKICDNIIRTRQKMRRERAYEEMESILLDMKEQKNDALDKIRRRFETKTKYIDPKYYEKIDIDLYKEMFENLRKEFRNIYKKTDEENIISMKDSRNQIFLYKDKAIVTLTFPNVDTSMEKYKTAAIIIDADDIKKVYIDSEKQAWTYKHSRKAPSSEYEIKTLKPDKVTTQAGKVDMMQCIVGDFKEELDKPVYFITKSHKFDFRKKCIEKVDKLARKENPNYHQGKIRIDQGNVQKTVCFNNKNNVSDASILYFDDMKEFADFLDNLQ
jgi:hypothetical protein